jgi:hypothetical protein
MNIGKNWTTHASGMTVIAVFRDRRDARTVRVIGYRSLVLGTAGRYTTKK